MIERPAVLPGSAKPGIEGKSAAAGDRYEAFVARSVEPGENVFDSQPDAGWFMRVLTWLVESNAHVYLVLPASFAEATPRRVDEASQ